MGLFCSSGGDIFPEQLPDKKIIEPKENIAFSKHIEKKLKKSLTIFI